MLREIVESFFDKFYYYNFNFVKFGNSHDLNWQFLVLFFHLPRILGHFLVIYLTKKAVFQQQALTLLWHGALGKMSIVRISKSTWKSERDTAKVLFSSVLTCFWTFQIFFSKIELWDMIRGILFLVELSLAFFFLFETLLLSMYI